MRRYNSDPVRREKKYEMDRRYRNKPGVREKIKQKHREWYFANLSKIRRRKKLLRQDNAFLEKEKEYNRTYHSKNKKKLREQGRAYYEANKEKWKEMGWKKQIVMGAIRALIEEPQLFVRSAEWRERHREEERRRRSKPLGKYDHRTSARKYYNANREKILEKNREQNALFSVVRQIITMEDLKW